MPKVIEGRVSIGRYNQGKYFIEISNKTCVIAIAEMELDEFAMAITGMGERAAEITLYQSEPAKQNYMFAPKTEDK